MTFGRGAIWRTTDRVATFALTEVDRTYKPGADAVRLDWAIADQTRLELVGAVGATLRPTDTLTLNPEAHFNGFGAWDPADYLSVVTSERVGIGEQIGLGKRKAILDAARPSSPRTVSRRPPTTRSSRMPG